MITCFAQNAQKGKDMDEKLLENVFEITQVAMILERKDKIVVEDSKSLFDSVVQIAKDFENQFDEWEGDYYADIYNFAEVRLMADFS